MGRTTAPQGLLPLDKAPPSVAVGQPLQVGQVGFNPVTSRDQLTWTNCVRTEGPTELPPPPRGPQGRVRTVDASLPLSYFKYRDLPQRDFADGIAPHQRSDLLPRRLRQWTKRPFTYGGNSFWALGRTPQPRRIRSISAGPGHKLYIAEREEYYSTISIAIKNFGRDEHVAGEPCTMIFAIKGFLPSPLWTVFGHATMRLLYAGIFGRIRATGAWHNSDGARMSLQLGSTSSNLVTPLRTSACDQRPWMMGVPFSTMTETIPIRWSG